jgi:hypothetical protein
VRDPGVDEDVKDHGLWLAVCAAVVLVVLRSFVFVCYEQNFDSDQAIVGLMAKHLSEWRSFPLFFYGQNYMLGVEAWIAVPFFWLGGPTVAMLRLPLVMINIAVVILLIISLAHHGVQPILGFMATLPIIAAGPVTGGQLVTALGASIEPLLYVLAVWGLRNRPVPLGILLCIGSLHREFTIFALPAIVVLQWLELREVRWSAVAKTGGAFAATWIAIDVLKQHVNISGPGSAGSTLRNGSLALEAVQVGQLLSTFRPSTYLARFQLLLTQGLADLFGVRPQPLVDAGARSHVIVGSWLAGGALAAAAILCAARLVWIERRGKGRVRFQVYLALVAIQALFAYGLHGGIAIETRTELNYVLLVLFLPVALFGAYFQLESKAVYRWTAVVLIAVWAQSTLGDNVRLAREYIVTPPPSEHRTLADYLTSHRIKYGRAGYWDSYRVTFLSRERVILASTETVRIPGYQTRVDRNQSNAVTIVRLPCDQGTHVAAWCVVDPFNR